MTRAGEFGGPVVIDMSDSAVEKRRELLETARLFLLEMVMGRLEEGAEEVFFERLPEEERAFLTTPNERFEFMSPMAALRKAIEFELKRLRQN